MVNRRELFKQSASVLVRHLNCEISTDLGYPDKPSWGYAFSHLLGKQESTEDFKALADKSLTFLNKQEHNHPNYSWEFVVFAMQKLKGKGKLDKSIKLDGYQEKGTRMFNWFLLRKINKIYCHNFSLKEKFKLNIGLYLFQNNEGLILDEFKTRSLQYHAFCLFILAHILEEQPSNERIKKHFLAGIYCAIKYVLADGTAIYAGRGQEQIFGYGALIYALEFCHCRVKKLDENVLDKIASKVLMVQREDGSYPLVIRENAPEKCRVSFDKDKPDGWYGYNTLYDYQPFLGYCLLMAGKLREHH